MVTILPDGSAFFTASFPLPDDHWIYALKSDRWDNDRNCVSDTPQPILDHSFQPAIVNAVRWAIRNATMNGRDSDFDPDALVQSVVYALCGPSDNLKVEVTD
jgi:hypothetical protein